MILYYAPGACSLADHIAIHEAGLACEGVRVDLRAKTTADGANYLQINPKGYVPALALDDGSVLTENIAILAWVTDQAPGMLPDVPLARYRLLEMLAYISTEIHKGFKPFFTPTASDASRQAAGETITKRLEFLAHRLDGDYLFGDAVTAADAYLYVMLRWARKNGVNIPDPLPAWFDRMSARPSVKDALEHEGLN